MMVAPGSSVDEATRLGQHIISFADDPAGQFDLLAQTYRAGLSRDCRCIFIADRTPPGDFSKSLLQRGCDIAPALETGQFQLFSSSQMYTRGGCFDPDRMLDTWQAAIADARAAGYNGVCASGEATWLARGVPGVDRWLEYEFRLNHLDKKGYAAIICLYDSNSLPQWARRELTIGHPFVHSDARVEPCAEFVADPQHVANVPLLEELEPPADQIPCEMRGMLLSALTDGELDRRRRDELSGHVDDCGLCKDVAETHAQIKKGLAQCRISAPAPEGLWDQVRRQLTD